MRDRPGIFLILLIFGLIWNPTIAQVLSPSTVDIFLKVEELRNVPDLQHSPLVMGKINEIAGLVKDKCDRNGGPTAFDDLADNVMNFARCMEPHFEMWRFNADLATAKSRNEWTFFLNKYCPKLETYAACGKPLNEAFKSCLEPQERKNFTVIQSKMGLLLDFICHDTSGRFATFFATGGLECAVTNYGSLVSCRIEAFGADDFDSENPLMSLELGPDQCERIRKFRSCVVGMFERCEIPKPANEIDSIFSVFHNSTACQDAFNSTGETMVDDTDNRHRENWNYFHASNRTFGQGNFSTTTPRIDTMSEGNSFESFLRRKCENNGGPTAYAAAWEALQLVRNGSDLLMPGITARSARSQDDVRTLVIKNCQKAGIYIALEKYGVNSLKPCFEAEEQKTLDVFHNVSTSMTEFVCQNGADHFASFLASGGVECVSSKSSDIWNCAQQNFESYIRVFSNGDKNVNLPTLGAEFCSDLENFKNCSVDVLAECEDQTASDLWGLLIDTMGKEIPCKVSHDVTTTLYPPMQIWTTTAAPELIGSANEFLATLSDIEVIFGFFDADEMNVTSKEVEKYVRGKCEANGAGPTAYDDVKGIPEYRKYWVDAFILDTRHLTMDLLRALRTGSDGELDNASGKYCSKLRRLENRMKHVAESVKPCLAPQDRANVDAIHKTFNLTSDFLCKNKGKLFQEFFASRGVECLAGKQQAVRNCMEKYYPGNFISTASPIIRYPLSVSRETSSGKFFNCVIDTLNECENKMSAKLLDDLMNHVAEHVQRRNSANRIHYADVKHPGV